MTNAGPVPVMGRADRNEGPTMLSSHPGAGTDEVPEMTSEQTKLFASDPPKETGGGTGHR